VIADSSIELGSFQANENPVILIVDDSRVMRVSMKKALSKEYTVIEAVDGEDAWNKLQEESAIQVVFSDLSMPNLDGYGFLERIRQSDVQHIRDIPFIVITGNDDSEGMHQKVLSLGATDLIGKPFKSSALRALAEVHVVRQDQLSDVPVPTDLPAVSAVDEQSLEASRAVAAELETMRDRVAQLTNKLAELEVARSTAIEANKTLQAEMDALQQRVHVAEQAQQTAQTEAQQDAVDQQAYEQLQQENNRLQTSLDETNKRAELAESNQQQASQALADHDASLEQIKAKFEQQLAAAEQAQLAAERNQQQASQALADYDASLEQIKAKFEQQLTAAEQAQSQAETALEQIKAQHQQELELAEAVASASTPAPSRTWLYVLMLIVGAAAGGAAGLYFSGTLF